MITKHTTSSSDHDGDGASLVTSGPTCSRVQHHDQFPPEGAASEKKWYPQLRAPELGFSMDMIVLLVMIPLPGRAQARSSTRSDVWVQTTNWLPCFQRRRVRALASMYHLQLLTRGLPCPRTLLLALRAVHAMLA